MRTLFTTLALLVSIGGVALTFITIRKPMKVRPNFDVIRIAISVVTIVVITTVSPIETAPVVAAVATALGLAGGFTIGRRAEIWTDDGKLWLKRAGIGLIVWGGSTVLLQAAMMANRADLVDLGRFGSWFGIGMQVGVFVGRMEPVALARAAAAASVAFAGWLSLPTPESADAQDDDTVDEPVDGADSDGGDASDDVDRWVLVGTDVAPMDGFTTFAHSPGSISATSDDERGYASSFTATYDPPPDVLIAGEELVMDVAVEGAITLGEVQRFSGLDVIQYSGRTWTDAAVGVGVNCYDPIGSEPLSCSEADSASGTFTWSIPASDFGGQLEIGVGALNCDCAIHYLYEFEAAAVPETAATTIDDDELTGGAGLDEIEDPDPFDEDEIALDPIESESVEPSTVSVAPFPELDDEEKVGAAGMAGTAAAAGLTIIESRGTRKRPDDLDGDDKPDPRDPDVGTKTDSWDPDGLYDPPEMDGEMILEQPGEADLESVGRTGSEFDDAIADWMQNLPPPGEGQSIDPLLDLMRAAAEQGEYWNRPFDPDELGRVWDALGAVADNPTEATAAELQEAIATLLDRQVGGMPTWLAAWAVRNPAAAAETIVRMGAAAYTGGASELALIPADVYRDISAAEAAAAARGERLDFGDRVLAGAKGQALGWFMDGAGRAWGANRAAAEGLEAAGDAVSGAGRAGREAVEEGFEAGAGAGRRAVDPDELAEQAARNTNPETWTNLDDVKPGTKIPPEHIRETGYTPQQAAELQRIAAEENAIIGTRTTNPDATRWIEGELADPKPVYVKPKTIDGLDEALGGPSAELKGQVGFFKPNEPPPGSSRELMDRYQTRLDQYHELKDTMAQMEAQGLVEVRNGVVYNPASGRPFAGDIDAVTILDKRTGRPLTGADYDRVVGRLKDSGAMLQHGAESNMVADIVRAKLSKLPYHERAAAFDEVYESAEKLAGKLNQNHLDGKEQVIWTTERGTFKGPQLGKLDGWQQMTRGDIPTRPVDTDAISTGLRSALTPLDHRDD